jgi:secreted trypsin-like serine protease
MPRPRRSLAVRVAVAVAVVAAATAAGMHLAAPPAGAIANGALVPDGQYRFSVKLTMTDIPNPDGSHRNSACSAALVAAQWIMTAGHCFHDVNRVPVSGPVPYPTMATVGRTDLVTSTAGHDVAVVRVVQSPKNDIALGRLASPVTDIAPLPLAGRAPAVGSVLRLVGWGATDSVNLQPVTHLRTGQFTVASATATTLGVTGLAPAANTSACPFDSGAPYFEELADGRTVLASVESTGPDCPHSSTETTARADVIRGWAWRVMNVD